RRLTDHEPNPTRETRSPLFKASSTPSRKDSRLFFAAAFEIPASSAIRSTKFVLFIIKEFKLIRLKFCLTIQQIYRLFCTIQGFAPQIPQIVDNFMELLIKILAFLGFSLKSA